MLEETHGLPCAAMQTGASLLRSGLEDIIKGYLKGKSLTSDNIFCSCYVGVISLWDKLIEESIFRLISSFGTCESVNDLAAGTAFKRCDERIENLTAESSINALFGISVGQNGRMISSVADGEAERNTVVLTDRPFLVASVAPCGCNEGIDTSQMF